jgi:hypothetical protein
MKTKTKIIHNQFLQIYEYFMSFYPGQITEDFRT